MRKGKRRKSEKEREKRERVRKVSLPALRGQWQGLARTANNHQTNPNQPDGPNRLAVASRLT